MARSVEDIQSAMLSYIGEKKELSGLTSTSKTAVYRLWIYVVARAIHLLEKLFDQHKKELTTVLREQKSGSLQWYQKKALDFQYGFSLIPGTDHFDNQDATEAEIAQSQIIKYAAVTEPQKESRLLIKVAGEQNGEPAPISGKQMESFKKYIWEIRYAGTMITEISYLPDKLHLDIDIYRDPLVLNAKGERIKDGTKPVEETFKQYLRSLPFDGKFIIQGLVDELQQVEGIQIVNVIKIERSKIDGVAGGYGAKEAVDVYVTAESGYFKVDNFSGIKYVVQHSDR